MEGAASVNNSFKAVYLNRFIEGAFDSNVFNDSVIQLRFGCVWMSLKDLLALLLRTDGGDDGVSMLEQNINDMSSNEARPACVFVWSVSRH